MAAPTVTVLTQGVNETPGTSFATASITPSAGKLIVLVLGFRSFNTNAFFPSSVTGCGLTWSNGGSAFIADSNACRVMVLKAAGDSPTTGALTISWSGVSQSVATWAVLEIDGGFPAGGTSLALSMLQNVAVNSQSGVSGSVGMGTFKNADSGTLGIFGLLTNQNVTPDTNFTEIAEQAGTTPNLTLEVEYQEANDNSIDPSWSSTSAWCGLGIEIPAEPVLANDDFADAIALSTSLPGSRVGDSTWNATIEVGEPELGNQDQSVWYTFTPASTGYYRFLFDNIYSNGVQPSFTFGALGVEMRHTTTLGDFVSFFDDRANHMGGAGSNPSSSTVPFGAGNDIELITKLAAGQTYTFKVYSPRNFSSNLFNSETCSFDIAWDTYSITPPANNDFADAEVVGASLPDTFSGTTVDATTEEGDPSPDGQTVWYKFTPSTSAQYKFTAALGSTVQEGPGSSWAYLRVYDGTGVSAPGDLGSQLGPELLLDPDATGDAVASAELTSGVTYYIGVESPDAADQGFNRRVVDFEVILDIVVPPDNDDFADATLISGASGTEDFTTAGSSFETAGDEPPSGYYNDPQTQGTVWFEWVCPATGDYKFEVETLEDPGDSTQITYDVAIWTGATLNALTSVVRNWAGEEPLLTTENGAGTAVGFYAVNGTTYWIQVTNWQPDKGDSSRLTWGANTVSGNTTAAADSFVVGRTHNHGNDDTEPPPDFATRLSAHDEWWFTDGQVGKCKWFKFVSPDDRTVSISGHQWDGFSDSGSGRTHNDVGLLVYKGADYASLTPAESTVAQGSVDAAMMITLSIFAESQNWFSRFSTVTGDIVHLDVDILTGETLWICLFGLYDADYAGSTPSDASEFEVDVVFGEPPPANDSLANFIDLTNAVTNGTQIHAGNAVGTTTGATSEDDEPAHGGFGPERSVWYKIVTPWQGGDFKIWVESAGDCVLSVYSGPFTSPEYFDLTSIAEDDDSGTGNWPEVTITGDDGNNTLYIAVDSKAETDFVLKYQRLGVGTPPANDDWASAEVHIGGFVAAGTTVGGTGEPEETFISEWEGTGATDGVWYKYTADFTGSIAIKGICTSDNQDGYVFVHVFQGASLAELELVSLDAPPGEFFFGNTVDQNDALLVDVVDGEDYYIRVATWSGGSEDFEIYVDSVQIYLNLTPSGSDEVHGTILDSAEVLIDLRPSGTDVYHLGSPTDAATVLVDLRATSSEFVAQDYVDTATVRVAMATLDHHDCYFHTEPSYIADGIRKWAWNTNRRWTADGTRRWTWVEGEGLPQIC